MENWKCKIGYHNYVLLSTQTKHNIVYGFSETPLMRNVYKCKRCGKIKYRGLYAFTNVHLDDMEDW